MDVQELIRDSYVPISNRQFDQRDTCMTRDVYWRDDDDDENLDTYNDNDYNNLYNIDIKYNKEILSNDNNKFEIEYVMNKFGHSYPLNNIENKEKDKISATLTEDLRPQWKINAKKNYYIGQCILNDIGISNIECVKVIHCK